MRRCGRICASAGLMLMLAAVGSPAQEATPVATTEPTPIGGTPTPSPTATATATATPTVTPTATPTPIPGLLENAADQKEEVKEAEARTSCRQGDLQTGSMFAVGGAVGADPGVSWPVLALIVAALVAAATFVAHQWRRRHRPQEDDRPDTTSRLEVAGTLVAILTGVAGLAGQFVPGLKASDRQPPEATMEVRGVHARITHGEFNRAMKLRELGKLDAREVGNVVWVRLGLRGYAGRTVKLQWASFDSDRDALIPGTVFEKDIPIKDGSDVQTIFEPVWVGHPKTKRFHAEFRLLDRGQVREMASTGRMKGEDYRYACPA